MRDGESEPYPWRERNGDQTNRHPRKGHKESNNPRTQPPDGTEGSSSRPDSETVGAASHTEFPEKINQRAAQPTETSNQEKSGLVASGAQILMSVLSTIVPVGSVGSKKAGISGVLYPSGMIREDEQVVFETRPTRWANAKNYIVGGGLIALAVATVVVVAAGFGQELFNAPLPGSSRPLPSKWYVLPTGAFLGGSVIYTWAIVQRSSTWYILTQDRLLKRKGIIRREDKRLNLTEINKTNTIRPIHMLPLRVGHIDVFTAATGEAEVRIEACRKINDRAELIDYQTKLAEMTPEERAEFARRHSDQQQ